MRYREVGKTGIRISEIGFGSGDNAGLMVSGSPEQQRDAISRALALGVNYFDTSGHYGDGASEINLGRRLKELGVRPYITTKVEVRNQDLDDIPGHVARSLDKSLERLGVDSIDFLQIHNGPVTERPTLQGDSYTHLWIDDYMRALEGLQEVQQVGKARFIGFITRGNDAPAAQKLIDTGAFDMINVSVNLLNPTAAFLPPGLRVAPNYGGILTYAAAHGVGTAIYSPLAGGRLTDNTVRGGAPHPLTVGPVVHRGTDGREVVRSRPTGTDIGANRTRALAFLSQEGTHNLAEAAIRFVLSLQGVTVVLGGFSDQDQVAEVAACSGEAPLSEEDMARIEMVWRANFGLEDVPEPPSPG